MFDLRRTAVETHTGKHLERRSLGSEAELRTALATAHKDSSNPYPAVMLAYALYMLTGQTALTHHQNTRYADVQLDNFATFAVTM